jgi:hypothetical protein
MNSEVCIHFASMKEEEGMKNERSGRVILRPKGLER